MELFDRVYSNLQSSRDKVLQGGINCIPMNFPRFSKEFPGIEQKTYAIVTANSKVGKTQITDYMFLYMPVLYAFAHPEQLNVKILYFTLEMSQEQKYIQFMSFLLYWLSHGKIRVEPKELRSVSKIVDEDVLRILNSDEYKIYFDFFERHVTFIDNIKNPFGIFKICKDYALANGKQHKKTITIKNNKTGEVQENVEIDDYYEPDNPDEYVIVILDHMALLTPENGQSLREAMVKLSYEYFVALRNKYHYIIAAVVQQAASQESTENFRLNQLKPSANGLGEAKILSRDCDIMFGLFSPFRHSIPIYEEYDITKFRDNIRFLEIIQAREGGGGCVCPLFFDGGVNFFAELPLPNDKKGLQIAYETIGKLR